jgi:hypothetical protein
MLQFQVFSIIFKIRNERVFPLVEVWAESGFRRPFVGWLLVSRGLCGHGPLESVPHGFQCFTDDAAPGFGTS